MKVSFSIFNLKRLEPNLFLEYFAYTVQREQDEIIAIDLRLCMSINLRCRNVFVDVAVVDLKVPATLQANRMLVGSNVH